MLFDLKDVSCGFGAPAEEGEIHQKSSKFSYIIDHGDLIPRGEFYWYVTGGQIQQTCEKT